MFFVISLSLFKDKFFFLFVEGVVSFQPFVGSSRNGPPQEERCVTSLKTAAKETTEGVGGGGGETGKIRWRNAREKLLLAGEVRD